MHSAFVKTLLFVLLLILFYEEVHGQNEDCGTQINKYENCMRQKLGVRANFKLDRDYRADLDTFQCNLVGCLAKNHCQVTTPCLSPNRDLKLPGNFSIQYANGRTQFLLKSVEEARQKMAKCGLDIIQKILGPRLEQCVRGKLNTSWSLPNVTEDQLAKNLSALILARNTVFQHQDSLREIARQLTNEAGFSCPNTDARRAAQYCIADVLEAAETKIAQPWHSPLASAQDFLSIQCFNTYMQIPMAINSCYDWSQPSNEADILGPYVTCLGGQQGFPFFDVNTDIVLIKTNTTRKLVNLMRDDLQTRTGKFNGNLTVFRLSATDECNPTFELTSDPEADQLEGNYNIIEVEKDKSYLLLPKNEGDFRRKKRDVDKKDACGEYNALKAKMDAHCKDAGGKPFKSAAPVAGSSQKQIENLLAAGQNAFDEGVVGPTIPVKQNIFGLNHPFLKYQELLNVNAPVFRRLTNFGHN